VARLEKSQIQAIYRQAPAPHRKTMLAMRKSILEIIPRAEEVLAYGMPAFRVDGVIVAGIMPAKNHVGYYPFSGSIVKLFPQEFKNYSTTKSAIHVPVDKPLSKTLLRKLIRARISQCPIKTGQIDISKYAKLDRYWKSIGVAAPARRGLVDNKLFTLTDLRKCTRKDFMHIHAMGPKASQLIMKEMRRKKITFKG
jgi:uncharacterized protein YdhG (YjbR/CyaY superfamily)